MYIRYWFQKLEGNPAFAESCYQSTMNATALPWSTIQSCFDNEYSVVQGAAKDATPKHDYVPWVLVDHTVLEQSSLLQYAICKAYTGTPPASCNGMLSSPPKDVCFNINNN